MLKGSSCFLSLIPQSIQIFGVRSSGGEVLKCRSVFLQEDKLFLVWEKKPANMKQQFGAHKTSHFILPKCHGSCDRGSHGEGAGRKEGQ